ncbi:MAG TPA: flagellar hook-basal body complex protein FliE [Polyangia bacterium]|jgi:flagellar hook-basal body complex protein FliE|nr:flagellar hook-basal body complex protein FliE [Polyangia bacterium]
MSIETIKTLVAPNEAGGAGAGAIQGIESLRDARDANAAGDVRRSDGPSFAETLGQALSAVESTQVQADDQAARVAMGGGNLHEMSLALEKADITLRLATKVRNKLLDAYNDIMRMGV